MATAVSLTPPPLPLSLFHKHSSSAPPSPKAFFYPSLPSGRASFKPDLDSGVMSAVIPHRPAMLTRLGNGPVWSTDLFPGSPMVQPVRTSHPSTEPPLFFSPYCTSLSFLLLSFISVCFEVTRKEPTVSSLHHHTVHHFRGCTPLQQTLFPFLSLSPHTSSSSSAEYLNKDMEPVKSSGWFCHAEECSPQINHPSCAFMYLLGSFRNCVQAVLCQRAHVDVWAQILA